MKFELFKTQTAVNIYFTLVFVGLFFYYGLDKTFSFPPQSVHVWRQTNSVSIAQNYYDYNYPFFKPEMHNQFCDGGVSGKSVGEFPIIYFTVAKLWKVFGNHIIIFRIVQLLILFFGLLALFRIAFYISGNWFWSGFVSLLLFTSPMVVFYGPNFLPDVPALAFVFMAWLFILKFYRERKDYYLWVAAGIFCLSMLLKITSAISFIAFGGWVLFELFFQAKEKRLFNLGFKQIVPFIIIIVPVVAWYWYVDFYIQKHLGHFSFHGIWPIWKMTEEQYLRISDALRKIYFKELFLPYTQYTTVAIWVGLLVFFRKIKPVYLYFLITLVIGFIIQIILWFQVLEGHDYYMINLLVVFAFVWIVLVTQFKKAGKVVQLALYITGIAFFVFNAYSCKIRINDRHNGWMNELYKQKMEALTEIEPYFQELGIGKEDKVISIPDYTINASLYYMKRKGYTEFGSNLNSVEGIYKRIEQGAKYLIINDSTIISQEYLKPFVTKKIGSFKNVLIYNLQDIEPQQQ